MTVAERLVDALAAHGVDVVFGFPSEQMEPYYAALAGSDLRHVHPRSEASAALMADGYARVGRGPGVCDGVGGPGAAYTAAGLVEAAGASSPVLALTGDNDRAFRGNEAIQDADNGAIVAPHVGASYDPEGPDRVVEAVDRAVAEALGGVPGPTHVNLPEDLLDAETDVEPRGGEGTFPAHRPSPEPEDVAALADLLADADRPVVVAGEGAQRSGAAEAVTALAREADLPVVTSMNAKGVVPEDDPHALGVAGRWGFCEVANDAVADADLVVGLGCRFGELTTVGWSLVPDDAALAHVDLDPAWLGRNYEPDVAVMADVRATVEALRAALDDRPDARGRQDYVSSLADARAEWRESYARRLESEDSPVDPARLTAELDRAIPDDGLLVAATSFPGFFTAAFYEVTEPGVGYIQARGSDGINAALPQALGAQVAMPDRDVVVATGDGGFGYHLADVETAVREELPVTVVVFDNESLASSKMSQVANEGVDVSTDFEPVDFAQVARGFGAAGAVVDDPDEFAAELDDAIARDRPTVLDVQVDPHALPPVITE